jgi:hypothetical protein
MVHRYILWTPQYYGKDQRSCEGGGRRRGASDKVRQILFIFGGRIRSSEAAMGGGARSAPLGVAMSPKRRVRAAHGRAREAKTH